MQQGEGNLEFKIHNSKFIFCINSALARGVSKVGMAQSTTPATHFRQIHCSLKDVENGRSARIFVVE